MSCAIGAAVLDVIESENLMGAACSLGERFLKGLQSLKESHEIVGDVRGRGLFLGFELVNDRTTMEPAAGAAEALVDSMRKHGILLSTDGPLHNVIKIKPPMVLSEDDVDDALAKLDNALTMCGNQKQPRLR